MEINKYTQIETWYIYISVVFMLINRRTYDGILSLLYYAKDSVIQIDINNKSIPQAYAS
jgi:hypothetical protein